MSQRHFEPEQDYRVHREDELSAVEMSDKLCQGFIHHDNKDRQEAIAAFAAVDRVQFSHLDEDEIRRAAEGYVDALWAKDDVEDGCRFEGNGAIDPAKIPESDWSPVQEAFERRAEAAGIDERYAALTTEAWIQHKTERGDYWTPTMHAQMLELRAVLQTDDYPAKPRSGQGGFGPEPTRYALGIEYHDARQWEKARDAMIPYFQFILDNKTD